MMDLEQIKTLVVRPSLQGLGMWSEEAEALVVGTAIAESDLTYIHQVGGGPALGLWQMEPATYFDIWDNYLAYRPELSETILGGLGYSERPPAMRLVSDLALGAAMCRIHYRRDPEPLPASDDLEGQAAYWKRVYNSYLGAGSPAYYVQKVGEVTGCSSFH